MNRKIVRPGNYYQRVFQWIALAMMIGIGFLTLALSVSSHGLLISFIYAGVVCPLCLFIGVYGSCYILFFDKIIFDSETQEISFPTFFTRKKIPYMSITDISLKETSYGSVKNHICFKLKTGKCVYCRGYISWFSKNEARKRTEKIIELLRESIHNERGQRNRF